MTSKQKHSIEIVIGNPLGFHIRPVQRFAAMAKLFDSHVEVELRGQKAPGKSIINLMGLAGRNGDTMRIAAQGPDADQCVQVLAYIARNDFFVEDHLDTDQQPNRHVERLASLASCFKSDITATVDGRNVDAKNASALMRQGVSPHTALDFQVLGEDARQARAIIDNLVSNSYYIEEEMVRKGKGGA